MIDTILEIFGLVRKSKVEKEIKELNVIIAKFRDDFWKREEKELKTREKFTELKDKIRKLESEYDKYDFKISFANNKLIRKDNEIKKLKEQLKWLKYENNYYRNRSKYIAVNNNISFEVCELLENKKVDK
jgi:DNA repair exonuclease SbcCD ATPase subunit